MLTATLKLDTGRFILLGPASIDGGTLAKTRVGDGVDRTSGKRVTIGSNDSNTEGNSATINGKEL